MKDYRLSEIKRDCIKNNGDCRNCRFGEHILYTNNDILIRCMRVGSPINWEIDEGTEYRDAQKTLLKEYLDKAKLIAERL